MVAKSLTIDGELIEMELRKDGSIFWAAPWRKVMYFAANNLHGFSQSYDHNQGLSTGPKYYYEREEWKPTPSAT